MAKALVDWNRERFTTRIVLKRFNAEETRAQIAALLDENISGDFSEAVYRETEGNPFFVEEVMKALIEQGSVRRESGRWKRCELADLVIPQSVKEAIGNRLDRVSAECNETLRAAAVLGKTFTIDELMAAVDGQNENKLLDALDEAVGAQLLAADGDEAFAFTHDKIREVLYEELNPIRRRRLHLRTAEGLEQHREKAPVAVETLAHHFIHAGEYERGLTYAKQAAAEAERIFAYDEAMAAYGRALECAESLGLKNEQLMLEEATGNAALASGDTLRATVALRSGARRWPTIRASARASSVRPRVRWLPMATNADSITCAKRCWCSIRKPTRWKPRMRWRSKDGFTISPAGITKRSRCWNGRWPWPRRRLKKRSLPSAPLPMSTMLGFLAGAHQHLGRFSDGNVWAWRAVEFGKKHEVPLAQALGYEFLGENCMNAGDWQKALEYAAQ